MTNAPFFPGIKPISYKGPESDDPLSYQFYDADRVVLGKSMAEHLRMAVCYWHTFCWDGFDIFGAGTFPRAWQEPSSPQEAADLKMAAAFEFFEKLGLPFYCFHDVDVAGHLATPDELSKELARCVDNLAGEQERTGVSLLWGTANLFSHPRYAAGGLTNPDPDNVACAIRQIRDCLEATHRLGGANYVLWGGREGYETLLNTKLDRELDNLGRFLSMVVEHKHKIGFDGTILIEPKPHEPMYHQYDADTQTVFGFLQRFGLEKEVKVNIEPNHGTLAGHTFAHEVAMAVAHGIMGSVDINCGNPQNGWDTDQFNLDVRDITLAMLEFLPAGGFETGGFNFDAKLRRQSTNLDDLFHAHIGGVDALARGLLCAADIIESGTIGEIKDDRYAKWQSGLGADMLGDGATLNSIADRSAAEGVTGGHTSGRQEYLENIVMRAIR